MVHTKKREVVITAMDNPKTQNPEDRVRELQEKENLSEQESQELERLQKEQTPKEAPVR